MVFADYILQDTNGNAILDRGGQEEQEVTGNQQLKNNNEQQGNEIKYQEELCVHHDVVK